MNKVLFSSKKEEWETPQDLFDELNKEFSFDVDVCALPENAKCKKFFTPEDDGLLKKWGGDLLVQSALWAQNWRMGKEGKRKQCDCCYAFAGKNGHKMVSRIHIWKS